MPHAFLLTDSELILNPDGAVYHLGLLPHHLCPLIITVGDPARVAQVSEHFDRIEHQVQHREFCTHIGRFAERRIMCISTGIGTDNVDIVFNELDALANIDLDSRQQKHDLQQLTFLRLGTSGTFQLDIPVDTLLASTDAIGLDGLGPFYAFQKSEILEQFKDQFSAFAKTSYYGKGDKALGELWKNGGAQTGTTLTCAGFYGPQRRSLRLPFLGPSLSELGEFAISTGDASMQHRLTNFEMETAGIYGLSNLLGHRALSVSAILANRATGTFSKQAGETVSRMISQAFDLIRSQPEAFYR